jgi:hypothetical protein
MLFMSDSITAISSSASARGTRFGQVGEALFHSRSRTGGSCDGSRGTAWANQAACSLAGLHQYMK